MLFARTATDICGCSFGFGGSSEDEDEEGAGDRSAFIASFLEQGFRFGTSLPLGLGFFLFFFFGVRGSRARFLNDVRGPSVRGPT